MLEEIITGLYKFEDASTVGFVFKDMDFVLGRIGGPSVGGIELRRAADTPCPWGLVRKESDHLESTASQASLSWVKMQLQTCLAAHLGCSANTDDPLLPTRVLDVGTGDNGTIKVVETKGLRAKYITLSHCWGGDPASMTAKLTAHSRDQYLQDIPYEALPLTFRDAVTATRSLDIRYLWIDSLCIIQKDEEKDSPQDKKIHLKDWEHESGRMCSVYQNCYLTLAAVDSTDCTGGLFFKRDKVQMEGNSDKGRYCFYGSRELRHHAVFFPLLQRGWVKQETLLSPRTLLYGKEEIIWLCRTHTVCQCSHFSGQDGAFRGFHKLPLAENARANFARPQPISKWYDIISEYSTTSLTHITDKLIAIEGIAEYMRPWGNFEYLAGLWAGSLAFDLLWNSKAYNYGIPKRANQADPLGKTTWSSGKWLFPTWSWASIQGQIGWDWASRFITGYSPDNVLIQHIKDKSLPANELRLCGVLVPSTLGVIQKAVNSRELYCPDLRNQEKIFGADKAVECLRVVQSGKDRFSLALVCVDEEKRQYERLGLLTFRYSGHDFWKCLDSETQVEVPPWWAPFEDWKGEEVEFTLI
ncbi:hypothetical protein CEP52_015537 [Fusarium oligoseptatum]|uniref:Heterokaryon incompatibility domain-containing protein n=1 Tax=Fusarium oligoseptatum TaxID=2604345 RepID=A0A428SC70_9HYPO|nr:hypothetical protein CEP52_015537 [Fusarium oligoseptatum]